MPNKRAVIRLIGETKTRVASINSKKEATIKGRRTYKSHEYIFVGEAEII